MDGMSMSMDMSPSATSSTSMPMSTSMSMTMDMTFISATNTPLFSHSWTPSTTVGYAFTCIFLIALSVCLRVLYAFKSVVERNWARKNAQRGFIVVQPDGTEVKQGYRDEDRQIPVAGVNAPGGAALDGAVRLQEISGSVSTPWRWSVDFPRALLYTVIVGIGYLEMLAVMTMNVGYFMSVLGGAFLGELVVGRYAAHLGTHH